MRLIIILALLITTGCAQTYAGATYRTSVGRTVTELFADTATTWQVGAEFRFNAK